MSSYFGSPISVQVTPTDPHNSSISTSATIAEMIALVKSTSQTPLINHVVASLIARLPARPCQTDLARAIWWWVKRTVRFQEDEPVVGGVLGWGDNNQELLISPDVLLGMPYPAGDCDDFSALVASLLCAARLPVWFVTVACDEDEPDRWSHVYACTVVDGIPMYMDVSHGTYPGWETDKYKFMKKFWGVNV